MNYALAYNMCQYAYVFILINFYYLEIKGKKNPADAGWGGYGCDLLAGSVYVIAHLVGCTIY